MKKRAKEELGPIQLGTRIKNDAAGILMNVTPVHVDVDLNMATTQDVYRAQGKRNKKDLYAPSKPLLEKLQDAAGIEIVSSEAVVSQPDMVEWQVVARQQLPDATVKQVVKTYRLDLRVPHRVDPCMAEFQPGAGGRYVELHAKYYWDEVEKALGTEIGKEAMKAVGLRKPDWFSADAKMKFTLLVEDAMETGDPDWHRRARRMADRRTKQTIGGMIAHILARAESGATMRMLRSTLGLAQTYTLDELKQGFDVIRAQRDHTLIKEIFGEEVGGKLLLGLGVQALGLQPAIVKAFLPEAQQTQESEVVDLDEPADEPAEDVIITPPPPTEDDRPLPEEAITDLEPLSDDILDPVAEPLDAIEVAKTAQGLKDAIENMSDDEQPGGKVQVKAQALRDALGVEARLPMKVSAMRNLIELARSQSAEEAADE